MTVTRWDPFRDLVTLQRAMDRLFEESFVRPGTRWTASSDEGRCALPIDVYATDEEVVLVATIPGMGPEDLDITIEGDSLIIKGEIKGPLENVDYVIQERPYGKFSRSLRLNVPVEADKAEATFDKGTLTLVIPKTEATKPRTIKVTSK
ncbi:MAG: hypothetical protein A2Y73_01885 [Chloroflexi bacterium RBG_13_56_8]|nr:MAG: hypothetical protein A2Y73_01885 [Chloroflexi bacterium RBG_13_56_8]